jgi:lipoprotein-anchoring transpeptidase ErfK/SrfK
VLRSRLTRVATVAGVVAAIGGGATVDVAHSATPSAVTPSAVTPAAVTPRVTTTRMLSPSRAVVALAYHRIAIYSAPGGRVVRYMSNRTVYGSLRTLLVMEKRSDGWLQVLLPVRPNGSRGWIRASAAMTNVTPMRIVVNRSTRTLYLLRGGVPIAHYPVAVGKPSTPTPKGLFYVTDKIVTGSPGGAYGPYALGLSGYSNVLTSFAGGDGVVGIHGTNADSSVGHPVTHGCIRLHNRDIPKLYWKIWVGTPVQIR